MSFSQKIIRQFKNQRYFSILAVGSVFFGLAFAFFHYENTENRTSTDFNSIAREIPVVVKQYPENFVKDRVTNSNTMSNIRYIWTQEIILEHFYNLFDDFHTARRYMLFVLVFLTSCTTFILYNMITKNTVMSVLATIASILGYIYGVDEFYGFQGVRCAIARYNFGAFAPILLFLFLKKYKEPKWLLLLFLLIGIGVNLHPPVAINMAIVFSISLLITDGFKKNLGWVAAFVIMVIVGALPFVLDFRSAILTRGIVEAPMSSTEFYRSGIFLLTNDFISNTFGMMFKEIIFPPFLSLLSLGIAFFIYLKNMSSNKNIIKNNNIIRLLLVMIITSYILLFVNLFLFGWLIPHLIGPNAFSLHRVHRVFFLLSETLLITFIYALWSDKTQSLSKRASISGILLLNLVFGFNWLEVLPGFLKSMFHLSEINYDSVSIIAIQTIFMIAVILIVLALFLANKTRTKSKIIIYLIIVVTIPTFCLSGVYKIAKVFDMSPVSEHIDKIQKEHNSLKNLARWAKLNTENTDLFMFLTDKENDSYYFKTRAIRSTLPTKAEGLHYLPIRQRKGFLHELEHINEVMSSENINSIMSLFNRMRVDYIIYSRKNNDILSNSYSWKSFFENDHFVVYSSNILY